MSLCGGLAWWLCVFVGWFSMVVVCPYVVVFLCGIWWLCVCYLVASVGCLGVLKI